MRDSRLVEIGDELTVAPVDPLSDDELPRCSIVILNWDGREHLPACFESLMALDYPKDRFEVILVDNGSQDGSVDFVRERYPWVRVLRNERNVGFSAGCNQGAAAASGAEQVVFLNNDVSVEPGWLRALVAPIVRGQCDATTARMHSWDGEYLLSAGGGMNVHGIGFQRGEGQRYGPEYEQPCQTIFACGGAMAMDAAAFADVGGFDEEIFAFYEDVELGWRTWVRGYSVQYVPDAVCRHRYSATTRRVPIERRRVLQVRNPLLACVKNYDEENLRRILPLALSLAVRRAFLATEIRRVHDYRIESMEGLAGETWTKKLGRLWRFVTRTRPGATQEVSRIGLADMVALNDLLGHWDHWMERRAAIQARRRRSDDEILKLFLHPLWCIEDDESYRTLHEGAARFLGIDAMFDGLTTRKPAPPPRSSRRDGLDGVAHRQ